MVDFRQLMGPTVRPRLPRIEDEERAGRQLLRHAMLRHKFDVEAAEFFEAAFGKETAARMGLPDTTLAPLPYQTAQLTTPGLYTTPPKVTGKRGAKWARMLDPETGALARARYWTRMLDVMYLTVGQGVHAQRIEIAKDFAGDSVPSLRPAYPFNIVVETFAHDPLRPRFLAELQLRPIQVGKQIEHRYFWDVFDITNPEAPSWAIRAADQADATDYRRTFYPDLTDPYPWRSPAGAPFMPYVWYRAIDTGEFNPEYRPGLRSGTLRSVANWTLTSHAALWGQGNHNFLGGVDPDSVPHDVKQAGGTSTNVGGVPLVTFGNTPGNTTVVPVEEGKQLQLLAAQTGINLSEVAAFANMYHMLLATMDGLNPSDATRKSANPTSGAALQISREDKRAFAAKVTPLFRESDAEAIRKIAWMMQAATGEEYADAGYSITYAPIEKSPGERKEDRDQNEWESSQGQVGPISLHLRLNPGMTETQALDAVVDARVEEARVDAAVETRLAELGLEAPDDAEVPPATEADPNPATDGDEE